MTMHLSREILNGLIDAELSVGEARRAREHLGGCAACDAAFQVGEAMRSLTRDALLAAAEDVSFEAMQARIATRIAVERPLGFGDRATLWLSEFFRYRRPVWIPAGALAAAAIVLAVLAPGGEAQAMGSSRVLSVASPAGAPIVFDVENQDGATSTGIVWITDAGGQEGG
jgi:anti-sigma factor RsiW